MQTPWLREPGEAAADHRQPLLGEVEEVVPDWPLLGEGEGEGQKILREEVEEECQMHLLEEGEGGVVLLWHRRGEEAAAGRKFPLRHLAEVEVV